MPLHKLPHVLKKPVGHKKGVMLEYLVRVLVVIFALKGEATRPASSARV